MKHTNRRTSIFKTKKKWSPCALSACVGMCHLNVYVILTFRIDSRMQTLCENSLVRSLKSTIIEKHVRAHHTHTFTLVHLLTYTQCVRFSESRRKIHTLKWAHPNRMKSHNTTGPTIQWQLHWFRYFNFEYKDLWPHQLTIWWFDFHSFEFITSHNLCESKQSRENFPQNHGVFSECDGVSKEKRKFHHRNAFLPLKVTLREIFICLWFVNIGSKTFDIAREKGRLFNVWFSVKTMEKINFNPTEKCV